ncbi:MAG: 2-amino-4-hydroxy-6-hydroxymethyldihydropteridine diphosphokinase [Pseudomonadota bacterium]|nr:2-amino-4-hydroxy-6-hydroxymethyldihydropteridine diphosphokinase [Pseudomonadota bacterium]
MPEVFVGAGSNDRAEQHLARGVEMLAAVFGPLRCSPVYQNPAVGFEGDDFLNFVIGFQTDRSMAECMRQLRAIEDACGRDRSGPKFSPRTLDFDLLIYGGFVSDDPAVDVPRGEILKYPFVLKPLADLAPEARHPAEGRTYADLWAEMAAGVPPAALTQVNWSPGEGAARS